MGYITTARCRTIKKRLNEVLGSKSELDSRINECRELLLNVNNPKLDFDTEWIVGEGAAAYVGVATVGVTYLS